IVLLLSGCAYKRQFLAEDFKPQDATLANVQMEELSILDSREKIPGGEPSNPPAKKITEQPDLSEAHRALISQEVHNHIGNQGRNHRPADCRTRIHVYEGAL